jgi:hypothetical protein
MGMVLTVVPLVRFIVKMSEHFAFVDVRMCSPCVSLITVGGRDYGVAKKANVFGVKVLSNKGT